MYSRSERKFLAPDADHANPNLGPGCYTADEPALIAGKILGNEGYAPFSSLTPRKSYFDDVVVRGPAPGAYATEVLRSALHNPQKAPEFGRSQVSRFGKIVSQTPGPGTYQPPDGLTRKAPRPAPKGLEQSSRTHPLTRQPLKGTGWGVVGESPPAHSIPTQEQNGTPDVPPDAGSDAPPPVPESLQSAELDSSTPAVRGRVILQGRQSAQTSPVGSSSKIMWKRKYGAPSIPTSRFAFGFQENEVGELIPRKPPKRTLDPGPAYNTLTSFAELSKHQRRGYSFPHSSGTSRLQFKTLETPAPGVYENAKVQQFYKRGESGNSAAVMTLAPCIRLTDEILSESKKKNIPGPGSYNIKTPIQENLGKRRGRINFGAGGGHAQAGYLNPEQTKTPGPGAYYPEFSEIPKPPAAKPQPFGSTTHRFDNTGDIRSKSAPAPGSYDVNEIDSMARRIQKRAIGVRAGAFGSVSERFPAPKTSETPGPGRYDASVPPAADIPTEVPVRALSTANASSRPPTRISRLMGQGPGHFQVGNLYVNPAKAHIPVFGTQTERFGNGARADLPPPGAYDVAESFDALQSKHRTPKTGGMVSGSVREVFPVKERIPGPGEYEPLTIPKREMRRTDVGGFLTTDERFKEGHNNIPGPGAYLSPDANTGLLRKTYNITLTEWGRRQVAAAASHGGIPVV
ncbi:uncharacterized protein SPPG_06178 [Spizellomyces punctatus DAOM BR117]|uniref:Sperm-tail PG-rich repeat-containing protein 2 n=1 Tax=Spizellomyces punctatus (strain DAOM BR117) TaxID=645134 RepID=A0A0L0HB91_SPIPD|nr:uncharacterized protein SPPG_06178 [Spizellomyces punctatus DAOM BR117]KNC98477.1 hypothetical protein SPPG_06178 [Spizellomyces punctatus DAOM BR117]|eukprot:XP_016606517.1 hypothetical protein SPPG_06178 [Spizellomyces punctatus DAOM BR117]